MPIKAYFLFARPKSGRTLKSAAERIYVSSSRGKTGKERRRTERAGPPRARSMLHLLCWGSHELKRLPLYGYGTGLGIRSTTAKRSANKLALRARAISSAPINGCAAYKKIYAAGPWKRFCGQHPFRSSGTDVIVLDDIRHNLLAPLAFVPIIERSCNSGCTANWRYCWRENCVQHCYFGSEIAVREFFLECLFSTFSEDSKNIQSWLKFFTFS